MPLWIWTLTPTHTQWVMTPAVHTGGCERPWRHHRGGITVEVMRWKKDHPQARHLLWPGESVHINKEQTFVIKAIPDDWAFVFRAYCGLKVPIQSPTISDTWKGKTVTATMLCHFVFHPIKGHLATGNKWQWHIVLCWHLQANLNITPHRKSKGSRTAQTNPESLILSTRMKSFQNMQISTIYVKSTQPYNINFKTLKAMYSPLPLLFHQ